MAQIDDPLNSDRLPSVAPTAPSTEPPNAILRGGSNDGLRTHLGRGAEPSTYRPGNGEEYRATNTWEDQLRVYQCAVPIPRQSRRPINPGTG